MIEAVRIVLQTLCSPGVEEILPQKNKRKTTPKKTLVRHPKPAPRRPASPDTSVEILDVGVRPQAVDVGTVRSILGIGPLAPGRINPEREIDHQVWNLVNCALPLINKSWAANQAYGPGFDILVKALVEAGFPFAPPGQVFNIASPP